MTAESIENLELRAIEQRSQLHETANELRAKVVAGREKLNISNNVREHFVPFSVTLSVLALALGYAAGGMFTGR
jgi:hypothetical protein